MPKWFVLDTNVLLHSPTSVTSFGDNTVVVPVDVIEELDKFKSMNDELGHNARSAIRVIDTARGRGSLGDGVTIGEEGGRLMIDLKPVCLIADGLSTDSPDNRIISVAYRLKREGKPVVLVSKDMNMRVKCDALGIPAEDFQTDKVPEVDELHTGWRELEASGDDIERLRAQIQRACGERSRTEFDALRHSVDAYRKASQGVPEQKVIEWARELESNS